MIRRLYQISLAPQLRKLSRTFTLIIAALAVPQSVSATEIELTTFEATRSDTLTEFPTHDQFVRTGVSLATDRLFEAFAISRPKPLWITPADGQVPNHWFEEAAAHLLFDRGFVVREAPEQDTTGARIWAVRYRFDRFQLSLPESDRHSFLGRIWVKRLLDLAVLIHVWDLESGELLWSNATELAVSDWVPKRRLESLTQTSSPLSPPAPPVTTVERLAEPVIVGAAIGALTILFFAVR
jgi:hypothetical protein